MRVRLDELQSFIPRALDPAEVAALHDMRIAAKRLRYILEVTAEACFGPYAETAVKRTKELQDLLGEIHDCDVQLPRVLERLDELRAADARTARLRAPANAGDLDPALATPAPRTRAPGAAWRRWRSTCRRAASCCTSASSRMWTRLERDGLPRAAGVRARASGGRADRNSGLHTDGNGRPPRRHSIAGGLAMTEQQTIRAVPTPVPEPAPPSDLDEPQALRQPRALLAVVQRARAQLAEDPTSRCSSALKFSAIFTSNLDEFFMIRVAGLHDQVDAGLERPGPGRPDAVAGDRRAARADRRR